MRIGIKGGADLYALPGEAISSEEVLIVAPEPKPVIVVRVATEGVQAGSICLMA